jgi:ABC-type multidrug transport system permease subunit
MSGELKLRAIVSIAQLVLGILLFISGLVLYFTPSGRAHEFIIFMSRGSGVTGMISSHSLSLDHP